MSELPKDVLFSPLNVTEHHRCYDYVEPLRKDEEAVRQQMEWVRYRLGFYGSTRSYHGVLAVHGWEELGMKLHGMSKRGRWSEMAAEIPDEVVRAFAAEGSAYSSILSW